MQLSPSSKLLVNLLAAAIARQESGLTFEDEPFKSMLRYDAAAVLEHLAQKVEELTEGKLTIRRPKSGVLCGYVSGHSMQLVLCDASAPQGFVADRSQVLMGYVFVEGGLLPAAFDKMPESAHAFIATMTGSHRRR